MDYEQNEAEEVEEYNSDDDIMDEYEEEMACLAKFGLKSKEGLTKKVQGRVPIEVAKFCTSGGTKFEEQKKQPEIIKTTISAIKEPNKTMPPKPIEKGKKRKRERKKLSKKC